MNYHRPSQSSFIAATAVGWSLFALYLICGGLGANWDIDESFRGQVVFNLASGQLLHQDFICYYIEPVFQLLSRPIVWFDPQLLPYAQRGLGMLCMLFAALSVLWTIRRLGGERPGLAVAVAPLSLMFIAEVADRLYQYRPNALSYALLLLALAALFLKPRRRVLGGVMLGLALANQLELAVAGGAVCLAWLLVARRADKLTVPAIAGLSALAAWSLAYGPTRLFDVAHNAWIMGRIVPLQYGPKLPMPIEPHAWFAVVLVLWFALLAAGFIRLYRSKHRGFALACSLVIALHISYFLIGLNRLFWQHFTLELLVGAPLVSVGLATAIQSIVRRLPDSRRNLRTLAACGLIVVVWLGTYGLRTSLRTEHPLDVQGALNTRLMPGEDCVHSAINDFYRPYTLAQTADFFAALSYSCPAPQTHYGEELYAPHLPHLPQGIVGLYQHTLHTREALQRDPAKRVLAALLMETLGREVFETCPAQQLIVAAPCAMLDDPTLFRIARSDQDFRDWLAGNYRKVAISSKQGQVVVFLRNDRPLAPGMREVQPLERIGLTTNISAD
ncbi:MAG: hypothetical protein P9M14_05075 [Candidatus Alcyoniella australis]|nr:hypothetical protein [Candidatus Alcyoniella australis]